MKGIKTERYVEIICRPWTYAFLLVIINSAICYLLFDIKFLLVPILLGILLLTLRMINRLFHRRNQKNQAQRTSIWDLLQLGRNYFKRTYKFTLASALGLILVLLLISQASIMSNSYLQFAFNASIDGSDTGAYKFSVKNVNKQYFDIWKAFFDSHKIDWLRNNNLEYRDSAAYGTVSMRFMLKRVAGIGAVEVYTKSFSTRQMTQYLFDFVSQLPSFPDIAFNNSESWLILPSTLTFKLPEIGQIDLNPADYVTPLSDGGYTFRVLEDQDVKYTFDPPTEVNFDNLTLRCDHYWGWTRQDLVYIRENNLKIPNELVYGTLLTPKGQEWGILDAVQQAAAYFHEDPFIWGSIGFESYLNIRIPAMFEISLKDLQDHLIAAKNQIIDTSQQIMNTFEAYKPHVPVPTEINSPLQSLVDNYLQGKGNLSTLMSIMSIPLIVLSLYLFYFSLSAGERKKEKILTKMKQRGATPHHMKMMIYFEVLAYSGLSPGIALTLSIFTSKLMLANTLIFSGLRTIPISIPPDIWWRIPLLGFLFALNFNLKHMNKIDKLEIIGSRTREVEQSIIERGNYDLLMFVFALVYYIVDITAVIPDKSSKLFYSYVGYLVLCFIIISVPYIAQRYLLNVVGYLSGHYIRSADHIMLAIQGIRRNKKFSSKFLATFLLTLLFVNMGIASSHTLATVNHELSTYSLGSDIYVTGIRESQDLKKLSSIGGIKSMSAIVSTQSHPGAIEIPPGDTGGDVITYDIMGINTSTFARTTYWDDSYASQPLHELLKKLDSSPDTVLFQSNIMKSMGLHKNESYTIDSEPQFQSHKTVKVVGTYDLFPGLITQIPHPGPYASSVKYIPIVTSVTFAISLLYQLHRLPQYAQIIRLEQGVDPHTIRHEIFSQLTDISKLEVYTSEDNGRSLFEPQNQNIKASPLASYEEAYLRASLTVLFFISVITVLASLLYYRLYILQERKEEIGIYRAFGMTSEQIQTIILMEILIVVAIAMVVGSISGLWIASMIFSVISGHSLQTVPPYHLHIPVLLMSGCLFVIVLFALFFGYRPVKAMTNTELDIILRGE